MESLKNLEFFFDRKASFFFQDRHNLTTVQLAYLDPKKAKKNNY
jgi:hypothetical protein